MFKSPDFICGKVLHDLFCVRQSTRVQPGDRSQEGFPQCYRVLLVRARYLGYSPPELMDNRVQMIEQIDAHATFAAHDWAYNSIN
jgi:hypothetical protein